MSTETRSSAEWVLDSKGVDRDRPTLEQLSHLTENEWLTVVDGIIGRTFTDDDRRLVLEQSLDPAVIRQRYYERQNRSMELLPPLLPWFIRRTR